ncbi:MAG: SAF domain-containing protein [Pirellulales bacterium]
MTAETPSKAASRHRPKAATVFVAAFVAGAVAAVVVNRVLDVHLAQAKPQVECEPIFVTLRPLAQGAPVTVWDVALRDWPRAMLPSTALRAADSFTGSLVKYPLREGQPLLSVHLTPIEPAMTPEPTTLEEAYVPPPVASPAPAADTPDRWTPAATAAVPPVTPEPATAATESPTAATEPTLATVTEQDDPSAAETAPQLAADEAILVAALPADAPEPAAQPANAALPARLTTDIEPPVDMPSRPAVDLDSLPSVMARSDETSGPTEESQTSGSIRYLVVPERIARQADTLFTTPVAPLAEAAVPAETPASQPRSTPQAGQRPATNRTQNQQSAQRNGSAASGNRPASKPSTQRPAAQPTVEPPAESRSELGPRAWGGMFPNLSAGAEALGNRWRGGERAASDPAPASQQRK